VQRTPYSPGPDLVPRLAGLAEGPVARHHHYGAKRRTQRFQPGQVRLREIYGVELAGTNAGGELANREK
jgi:hypothetical protein